MADLVLPPDLCVTPVYQVSLDPQGRGPHGLGRAALVPTNVSFYVFFQSGGGDFEVASPLNKILSRLWSN